MNESIEWRVLAKQDKKVLIISEKALDAKAYNSEYKDITWEECSLREWLNNEFFNTAFSSKEKKKIADTKVMADKHPYFDTIPGNDTNDKIFILSYDEAEKYFYSNDDRQCLQTDYAEINGIFIGDDGNCWWWLRTPAFKASEVAVVCCDGSIGQSYGDRIIEPIGGIRPAMWLKN